MKASTSPNSFQNSKWIIILFLFVLQSTVSTANTYYFSSSTGNDSYTKLQARNSATPWRSIKTLNDSFSLFAAGDSILFKRGDTFYGSIVCSKSGTPGSPIVLSCYGTGSRPIISGLTTITSWTLLSTGIYRAPVAAKNSVNLVLLNGIPQAMGRYPNANDAGGGYLANTGYSGDTSITATGLSPTNWTGAQAIIKKSQYKLEKNIVTSQSGNTIKYRPTASINPRQGGTGIGVPDTPQNIGLGLFIQRDPRTLDQPGEWYYDTTGHYLQMYFGSAGPGASAVKISTIDTLININTRNYITVDGLELEGANLAAIYYQDNDHIVIKRNTINFSGAKGIFGWNSPYALIDSNSINYALCGGIDHTGRHAGNVTVSRNMVKNTATLPGMSAFYDIADATAIMLSVDTIGVMTKNRVDTVGYIGLRFQGSLFDINSNYVNYFCFVKDDGGGIYNADERTAYGRKVWNNIVLNGIGCSDGVSAIAKHDEGIYLDNGARGVDLQYNTIAHVNGSALRINTGKNINFKNNTIYDAQHFSIGKSSVDSLLNVTIQKNTFFNVIYPTGQNSQTYNNNGLNSTFPPIASTIQQALQLTGNIDSNNYQFAVANINPFNWYYAPTPGAVNVFSGQHNFAYWKSYTNHDTASIAFSDSTIATQIFDYNASDLPKVISFPGLIKKTVSGISYTNSYTIPAWSSTILLSDGTCSLPAGWATLDIGTTAQEGSACENSGIYTLKGAGTDVFGNSDGFRYAYKK